MLNQIRDCVMVRIQHLSPPYPLTAGLHCSFADSVELDPPAVLLRWNTPERKHSLLPGMFLPVSYYYWLYLYSATSFLFLLRLVFLRCEGGRGQDQKDARHNEEEVHMWPLHHCHAAGRPAAGCSCRFIHHCVVYFKHIDIQIVNTQHHWIVHVVLCAGKWP